MGLDMLVEFMKILKLAMGKAPCLCLCYVLKEMFSKLFKRKLFSVECHMCHQGVKTLHLCLFIFHSFLVCNTILNFFCLFKNFSLLIICFLFLCSLFDSWCSCQISFVFFFGVVVLIFLWFFPFIKFSLFCYFFCCCYFDYLNFFMFVSSFLVVIIVIFLVCYFNFFKTYKFIHKILRQTNWLRTIEHFNDMNIWRNLVEHLLALLVSFTR